MSKDKQSRNLPKYVALQEAIRAAIEAGRYPAGEPIPPEMTLAAEAQVARMTVRQAISGLVEEGVLERRRGVGTFVRASAGDQNLAMLFFAKTATTPQSLACIELDSLREAATKEGNDLRAIFMVAPYQAPSKLVAELRTMGVGAVGLVGFGYKHRDYIDGLRREIPCVLLDKELPGIALPCAKPDLGLAARQVVDYFVARGRKRIGVMVQCTEHPLQRELMEIMESELHTRNMPVDKGYWFEPICELDRHEAGGWVTWMLSGDNRPDALLVLDEKWPHMIHAGLAERGERLGQDLDLALVTEGLPEDGQGPRVPWARLSLEYGRIMDNAQRLLMDAVRGALPSNRAPVLVSETSLIPPEE